MQDPVTASTEASLRALCSVPPLVWDAATRLIRTRRTTLVVNPRGGNWMRLSGSGATLVSLLRRDGPSRLDSFARGVRPEQLRQFVDTLLLGGFAHPAGSGGSASRDAVPAGGAPATSPCAVPLSAALLNVTRRCNLRCAHCGVCAEPGSGVAPGDVPSAAHGAAAPPARPYDPSPARLNTLIERLARLGVSDLVLFGGEPLLHPRFADVLDCAARNVARVGVATNGTLLDAPRCHTIAARAARVCVSLDGSRAEVHDAIRGAGSFQRTIDGIRRLQSLGGPAVGIKAVIMRKNVADIPNLVKLAARLRVSLELTPVIARGRAGLAGEEIGVTAGELLTTMMRVWLLAEYYEVASVSFNAFCARYMSRAGESCGAGAGTVLVDGGGAIFPCDGLQSPSDGLGNLLTDADAFSRQRHQPAVPGVDARPGCARCAVRYFCKGGCAADAAAGAAGGRRASTHCRFFRLVLPAIAARYDQTAGSWSNLKRVFGNAAQFEIAEEYLP
jgi:radical SAM protein with 4Fe4S-binding SPASM domain